MCWSVWCNRFLSSFLNFCSLNLCWTPTQFTVCTAQKRRRQKCTITQSNQHKSASLQSHRKEKLDLYVSLVSFSFQRGNLWRETCFGHHKHGLRCPVVLLEKHGPQSLIWKHTDTNWIFCMSISQHVFLKLIDTDQRSSTSGNVAV